MKLQRLIILIEKRRPILSIKGWNIKGPSIAKAEVIELKRVDSRSVNLKSAIKAVIVKAGKEIVNPKISEQLMRAATVP